MKKIVTLISLAFVMVPLSKSLAQDFTWPEGKQMAISFTWDDGRSSQVEVGTPILNKYGIKATFYVVPSAVERSLDGWKQAVADGHEIANHTMTHPCSGNFLWAREKALEEMDLEDIRKQMVDCNARIKELLGVEATEFAYPCGQTYVGRGEGTQSYVPVVAQEFVSGRTWLDEAPNDPAYCDMAQLTGVEMDGKDFNEILSFIEVARKDGLWLVLAGHDIGPKGRQTTEVKMLNKLFKYLNENEDIWVAPVGDISKYVVEHRPTEF
ncbi:MAG: polysaccharide deacetylase family protein [Bacteroidota bacterium]